MLQLPFLDYRWQQFVQHNTWFASGSQQPMPSFSAPFLRRTSRNPFGSSQRPTHPPAVRQQGEEGKPWKLNEFLPHRNRDRNRALTCGPGFYLLSIPTLIDSEREGRFSASARYVFSQREMWSRAVGRGPAWRASPPCPGGARASGAPHAASQHQALQ